MHKENMDKWENMDRKKLVTEKDKKREMKRKRDGFSKCSSTQAHSCEFPGKSA